MSANDFFEKLKREIWRLHEAQFQNDDDEIFDHGLNAAITAWHLHEVIARENGLDKVAYRDDVKKRCPDLGLMHDIATQAKHFNVTSPQRNNPQDDLELKTIVRPYITEEEWNDAGGEFFGTIIKPLRGDRPYKLTPYRVLKVDVREVEEILEAIEYFWRRELEKFKLSVP